MAFLTALHFLTIIPAGVRREIGARELGRAVGFFPLVGLVLGGVLNLTAWGFALLFPPHLTAVLVLALWVLLTGALHLDGFLDACDGLFGGRTPEARLRIMRDERVGAFALAGGVLLLLAKYAALSTPGFPWQSLLLAPVLGRWAMSLAVVAFPYARAEGTGRAMKDHAGPREVLLAGGVALGVALWVAGWEGVAVWGLTGIVTWLSARFTLRRIPGLTGDIYGAMCEVVEVGVLVAGVVGRGQSPF